MIICNDKKEFEEQLEEYKQFRKCPTILVCAEGLVNSIYGACAYMNVEDLLHLLEKVAEKINEQPDKYVTSIRFEDLIVQSTITLQDSCAAKTYNIDIGKNICRACFKEFFIALCKHYHNRNSQVEVKEVIR